jgi:hypothetical protein
MDFLFSGLFWGIILILCGVSIIIRIVFHIHIPLVRIVFALILIYLGVRVLVGGSWLCSHRTAFGSSSISLGSGQAEYKVIFGSSTIDATAEVSGPAPQRTSIKTVFGECRLAISATIPTVVRVNSAFAEARLPDGNSVVFGNSTYKNAPARDGKAPLREIDAHVVFGNFVVSER